MPGRSHDEGFARFDTGLDELIGKRWQGEIDDDVTFAEGFVKGIAEVDPGGDPGFRFFTDRSGYGLAHTATDSGDEYVEHEKRAEKRRKRRG